MPIRLRYTLVFVLFYNRIDMGISIYTSSSSNGILSMSVASWLYLTDIQTPQKVSRFYNLNYYNGNDLLFASLGGKYPRLDLNQLRLFMPDTPGKAAHPEEGWAAFLACLYGQFDDRCLVRNLCDSSISLGSRALSSSSLVMSLCSNTRS